jgi:hypothetical protein
VESCYIQPTLWELDYFYKELINLLKESNVEL